MKDVRKMKKKKQLLKEHNPNLYHIAEKLMSVKTSALSILNYTT